MARMKNIIVTGAANGLGSAIAIAADLAGYRVGVLDLDQEQCDELVKKLKNGMSLPADVTDPNSIDRALERFAEVPDVLVNNAGILRTGPLIDHNLADFKKVMDINLNGVFIVSKAAARMMMTKKGGAIVNMSSINGIHPSLNCGAYVAAKAGVIGLTQQMSIEWGDYGIRVNAVAPGFIDAGMSAPFFENEKVRKQRADAVPLGVLGEANDVADCVLFLASDKARYINGHTIPIDGGVINSVLRQLPRE